MEKTEEKKEKKVEQKAEKHDCCKEGCKCKEHEKKHNKHNKLQEENDKLKKEVSELEEKVKYTQAELINYRKRKDEEFASYKKYCNQDLISEIIPILDNFERATSQNEDKLTDEMKKFLTGFKMMKTSLWEALKKFGVEEINNIGEPFNSMEEEALMTDCDNEKDDDVVLEVLLKGYKLKDRVIRPASVKINKKD